MPSPFLRRLAEFRRPSGTATEPPFPPPGADGDAVVRRRVVDLIEADVAARMSDPTGAGTRPVGARSCDPR